MRPPTKPDPQANKRKLYPNGTLKGGMGNLPGMPAKPNVPTGFEQHTEILDGKTYGKKKKKNS